MRNRPKLKDIDTLESVIGARNDEIRQLKTDYEILLKHSIASSRDCQAMRSENHSVHTKYYELSQQLAKRKPWWKFW